LAALNDIGVRISPEGATVADQYPDAFAASASLDKGAAEHQGAFP